MLEMRMGTVRRLGTIRVRGRGTSPAPRTRLHLYPTRGRSRLVVRGLLVCGGACVVVCVVACVVVAVPVGYT